MLEGDLALLHAKNQHHDPEIVPKIILVIPAPMAGGLRLQDKDLPGFGKQGKQLSV